MKVGYLYLASAFHGLATCPLPVTARSETSTRNGQPEEIVSIDGRLEVTLDVSLVTTPELNRVAPGYNGGPVGPTLRAKPGDTVHITLINNLAPSPAEHLEMSSFAMTPVVDDQAKEINQTLLVNRLHYPTGNLRSLPPDGYWGKNFQNLHFHGILVDPSIDDGRVYIDGGGTSMVYEFEIPPDSPPLFGFYHNDVHGTATYSSLSGLFGCFIIEDPVSDPLPSYIASTPQVSEHFLLLSESKNYPDGTPVDFISPLFQFDWEHVTNGQLNPTYTFKKGEVVHFRVVHAGVSALMQLSIENHTGTNYAHSGYPLPNPVEGKDGEDGWMFAGTRAEFIVKFENPGSYKFTRAPQNFGIGAIMCKILFNITADTCISWDKETDVALIVVLDEEVGTDKNIMLWDPTDFSARLPMDPYLKKMLELPKGGSRVITFDQADEFPIFQIPYEYDGPPQPVVGFGVNNMLFNPHYFHGEIIGGTCEEWTIKNTNGQFHSVHTHSVPFYVTSWDGIELGEEGSFWSDTFIAQYNFTATVCFPPRKTESYINVLCHSPQHQDGGMAAYYKLLPGGPQKVDNTTQDGTTNSAQNGTTNSAQNGTTGSAQDGAADTTQYGTSGSTQDDTSGCVSYGMDLMVIVLAGIILLFV